MPDNNTIPLGREERLFIQWILGKNRGIAKPLAVEDLAELLNKGLLEWKMLGEEERAELSQDHNHGALKAVWSKEKTLANEDMLPADDKQASMEVLGVDKDKFSIADLTMRSVMQKLPEAFPEFFVKEEWFALKDDEKQSVYRFVFGLFTGLTPEQFRLNVYKTLGGTLG